MKAIRLVLACFLALSLILSPAASLAQAPTQEILQNSLPKSVNAAAINWCFAGGLNGWNNSSTPLYDDGTFGDQIPGDGVYSWTTSVPTPGDDSWKAVECGSWSNTHPAQNSWFTTTVPNQSVSFTVDTNDYSTNAGMALLPASNIVNVRGDSLPSSFTAVGDFQGWNNTDPNTGLDDLGNGFYRLIYTIPTAGNYIGKVVVTGSWLGFGADGRSSDAANINFTTTTDNQDMVFLLDSYSGRLLIEPVSTSTGPWHVAGAFNDWNNASTPLFDDGTNGDAKAADGVFTTLVDAAIVNQYYFVAEGEEGAALLPERASKEFFKVD